MFKIYSLEISYFVSLSYKRMVLFFFFHLISGLLKVNLAWPRPNKLMVLQETIKQMILCKWLVTPEFFTCLALSTLNQKWSFFCMLISNLFLFFTFCSLVFFTQCKKESMKLGAISSYYKTICFKQPSYIKIILSVF